MVVQGEMLNAGGTDDEDDEQKLGFVQRTFVSSFKDSHQIKLFCLEKLQLP